MRGRAAFLAVRHRRNRMSMRKAAPNGVFSIPRVRPQVFQEKFCSGYDGDMLFGRRPQLYALSQILM